MKKLFSLILLVSFFFPAYTHATIVTDPESPILLGTYVVVSCDSGNYAVVYNPALDVYYDTDCNGIPTFQVIELGTWTIVECEDYDCFAFDPDISVVRENSYYIGEIEIEVVTGTGGMTCGESTSTPCYVVSSSDSGVIFGLSILIFMAGILFWGFVHNRIISKHDDRII